MTKKEKQVQARKAKADQQAAQRSADEAAAKARRDEAAKAGARVQEERAERDGAAAEHLGELEGLTVEELRAEHEREAAVCTELVKSTGKVHKALADAVAAGKKDHQAKIDAAKARKLRVHRALDRALAAEQTEPAGTPD